MPLPLVSLALQPLFAPGQSTRHSTPTPSPAPNSPRPLFPMPPAQAPSCSNPFGKILLDFGQQRKNKNTLRLERPAADHLRYPHRAPALQSMALCLRHKDLVRDPVKHFAQVQAHHVTPSAPAHHCSLALTLDPRQICRERPSSTLESHPPDTNHTSLFSIPLSAIPLSWRSSSIIWPATKLTLTAL